MQRQLEQTSGDSLIPWPHFLRENGLSVTTGWRFKKQGFLSPINITGRLYIRRSDAEKFLDRATAGDFARPIRAPGRKVERS